MYMLIQSKLSKMINNKVLELWATKFKHVKTIMSISNVELSQSTYYITIRGEILNHNPLIYSLFFGTEHIHIHFTR